jgi:hypothetical protein
MLERFFARRRATDDGHADATDDDAVGRRAFLRRGGIAAAGAAVATAVSASPAGAATGNMQYGSTNDAGEDETSLTSSAAAPDATLIVSNTGSGPALSTVNNSSTLGTIIAWNQGSSAAIGATAGGPVGAAVVVNVGTGSALEATDTGVLGDGTGRAVHAHLDNTANASDVVSASTAGTGAALSASTSATAANPAVKVTSGNAAQPAVRASGLAGGTGLALDVRGKAQFNRSGLLTIASANNKLTGAVPGGLNANSRVLAMMQSNSGTLAVRAAVPILSGPNVNKIQIYLTGNAPAGGVKVAWFVFG